MTRHFLDVDDLSCDELDDVLATAALPLAEVPKVLAGRGAAQPEPVLGGEACLPHPVVVVRQAGAAAVLAGQGGDDVNMILGVPDGDPADRVVFFTACREPGAVHDLARHVRPFVIAEHPVTGSGPCHAVPDRPGRGSGAERGQCLLQEAVQLLEIAAPAWA